MIDTPDNGTSNGNDNDDTCNSGELRFLCNFILLKNKKQ